MRRRDFIAALSMAVASVPSAARAQKGAVVVHDRRNEIARAFGRPPAELPAQKTAQAGTTRPLGRIRKTTLSRQARR